jgi:oligoendopeptidase F
LPRRSAGWRELEQLFDKNNVGGSGPVPSVLDEAALQTFEAVVSGYNALYERARTLGAYISSFVATDSRDALAQARQSEWQPLAVRLSKLATRFVAYAGAEALPVDDLLARSEVARAHEWALRRAQQDARHLMSPAEEALAAEMRVTGGLAWTRLHGNLTSQIIVPFAPDPNKPTEPIPMSALRALAFDADANVRRRAYEAELAAWERHALPLASALNSIKGETITLSRRRQWDSPLDEALWNNYIDRTTLDAMMTAARESFPDFRRYLRAKARALGHPANSPLPWHDLFAPLNEAAGASERAWAWDEATHFVADQFATYSPKMADFARRSYDERWIDAGPRPGKRDGAFCMGLRPGESRILMNYKPAFGSVNTLAHELGHAYHNLQLAGRTPLQKMTPMTLAETASIFCETIVRRAALQHADPAEELAILEAALESNTQVVVDISSRFLFEQRVFERRANGNFPPTSFAA